MMRACEDREFEAIRAIINDGAQAYRGVIPVDRWIEPYMSQEELRLQIGQGVRFWGFEAGETLVAVMGLQQVEDVTLIRHAYVRSASQKRGIGTKLLTHLLDKTATPVLVGTWADAVWAIRFYQRHGFEMVDCDEKNRLLRRYWIVPERQIETSVVLADERWRKTSPRTSTC